MCLCPQAKALSIFGNWLLGRPHLLQLSQASLWRLLPGVHLVGLSAGTSALELSASKTLWGRI